MSTCESLSLSLQSALVQEACGAPQGTSLGPFSLASLTDTDLWHKHILLFSATICISEVYLCLLSTNVKLVARNLEQ